jgi:hypothetical protein
MCVVPDVPRVPGVPKVPEVRGARRSEAASSEVGRPRTSYLKSRPPRPSRTMGQKL